MKILSQNLAKIRQDQGHVFKQRPGDHIETHLFNLTVLSFFLRGFY